MLKQGKIIKILSNQYTVLVDNNIYEASARGKFRNLKITPTVGDYVTIDIDNKYILEIHERKNSLLRPNISNVDVALIICSVKEPKLSLNLLDKMISIVTINKINPIICFSKIDLLNKEEKKEINKLIKYYQKIGYQVVTNKKIRKIKKILKNKIIVITGQTGVGKSTLLNKLNKNLHLETNEISKSLGRGKHTTRHTELFNFKTFYVADTPGFSSLDFNNISKEEIKNSFIEFKNYNCKFKNCMHKNEQDCEVIKAVKKKEILESRYNNYKEFIER